MKKELKTSLGFRVVSSEIYRHYKYFIIYNDCWYCAYVEIPITHEFYRLRYDEIPIAVHGGLTFAGDHSKCNYKFCIGWDYSHYGDYNSLFDDDFLYFQRPSNQHKWTVEEIEEECKDVINQLIHFDDKLIKVLYE